MLNPGARIDENIMGRKVGKTIYLCMHDLQDTATSRGLFPAKQTDEHEYEEEDVYSKCGKNAYIAVKCILNHTFVSGPIPTRDNRALEHVKTRGEMN